MSPQQVQSICALLKKDLATKGEDRLDERFVDDLAAIGSAGRNPQHMSKQLVSLMYGTQKVPRLLRESGQFRAPLKNSVAGRHVETLDFLCPHIVFATLYHDHIAAWRQLMVPSQDELRRFWGEISHTPQYQGHPVRLRDDHESFGVPLTVHGDGTPVTGLGKAWGKMMNAWSWSSFVVSGSTEATQILMFCIFESIQLAAANGNTLDAVFKKMRWSLYWLWRGEWPTVDHLGKPVADDEPRGLLADGYFGVVWGLLGDLDYLFKVLNFPNYNAARNPCGWCPCNTSWLPWFDFRPGAAWTLQVYDEASWRARGLAARHELFQLPGVSSQCCIALSTMYCKAAQKTTWPESRA